MRRKKKKTLNNFYLLFVTRTSVLLDLLNKIIQNKSFVIPFLFQQYSKVTTITAGITDF